MRLLVFISALIFSATAAHAQTWAELHAMQKETTVRVFEVGGQSWKFADGKLLLVKDDELTLLRRGRAFVIPKASIARIETRHRDSIVQGALIGALVGVAVMSAGAGQPCNSVGLACAGGFMLGYGLVGSFIDWQIVSRRTVYRAP